MMDTNLIKIAEECAYNIMDVPQLNESKTVEYCFDSDGLQQFAEKIQPQWLPIETAPKDEEILLCAFGVNFDIAVCWWDDGVGWTWGFGKPFVNPSHWMPIPPPPRGEK